LIWTRSPAPAAPALHKQQQPTRTQLHVKINTSNGRMIRHLGETNPRFFMEQCNLRNWNPTSLLPRYQIDTTKTFHSNTCTHTNSYHPPIYHKTTHQCEEEHILHHTNVPLLLQQHISRRKFPTFFSHRDAVRWCHTLYFCLPTNFSLHQPLEHEQKQLNYHSLNMNPSMKNNPTTQKK
jgi:hypothetical protein